jgi:hypothetical protein
VTDAANQSDSGKDPTDPASWPYNPELRGSVCSQGANLCLLRSDAALMTFGYEEQPRYEDDYNSGDYERTLSVGIRSMISSNGTDTQSWETDFEAKSDRPSKGRLGFAGSKPWGVLTLPGTVHWHVFTQQTDCTTAGGAPDQPPEPQSSRLAQGSLRDPARTLLMAGGAAPLRPDGTVWIAAKDTPEVSLRWKEAGCQPCPGLTQRTVAMELTVVESGMMVTALPGQRRAVQIGGQDYVFMVALAAVPTYTDLGPLCGGGSWGLYRTDVWVELNADGSGPQTP